MVDIAKSSLNSIQKNSPRLFTPLVTRGILQPSDGALMANPQNASFRNVTDAGNPSTVIYGQPELTGLVSTQQLMVDWSKFENHTFYSSAEVNVNVAIDRVLNEYPFFGTQQQVEAFQDGLSGFEKWVFESFPQYEGYLYLQGVTSGSVAGTYVTVMDAAGAAFPNASTRTDGKSFINPGTSSFTVEFQLYLPTQANGNSFVLDKHTGYSYLTNEGIAVSVDYSTSTSSAPVTFHAFQAGKYLTASMHVNKGAWNHIAFTWDRSINDSSLLCYLNCNYVGKANPLHIGSLDSNTQSMYVGSGSQITGHYTPTQTLSGSLDELRIWHTTRSLDQLKENYNRTIFAQDALVAYYRFDEAIQDFNNQSYLVADSSGNDLHGKMSTWAVANGTRCVPTASIGYKSAMVNSRMKYLPVLFPENTSVLAYRDNLQVSASLYDEQNPSLITKLVPKHYIQEGMIENGYNSEGGPIMDDYDSSMDPRSSKLGGTQAFLLLLYTWARFFDDLTLFTRHFGNLNNVDYDEAETTPDAFLRYYAKRFGMELPSLFQDASLFQYVYGDDLQTTVSVNDMSLQQIQNKVWRRILSNLKEVLDSKGTVSSLKSFVRSVGFEPDNIMRIREYGGPTKRTMSHVRDFRAETTQMLDFTNGGLISGSHLIATRTEPGYPTYVPAMGTGEEYSLFSGSFTYEGTYRISPLTAYATQSLVQLYNTIKGSIITPTYVGDKMMIANLQAKDDSTVTLYYRCNAFTPGPSPLEMTLTGANLYDGDLWYVSFGRRRWDDNQDTGTASIYFLRAAKQINGEIYEMYETTQQYDDSQYAGFTPYTLYYQTSVYGASGSFFMLGSQSVPTTSAPADLMLNSYTLSDDYRWTQFDGEVTEMRFYSKYLNDIEWKEHVRNFRSVGVLDPTKNWNFDSISTGSWERLRMHIAVDQPTNYTDSLGNITLVDYTQNNYPMYGVSFDSDTQVLNPRDVRYTYLSPYYDSASTIEKVRVRGFNDQASIQNPWEGFGPAYEINASEVPYDNTKITIDFSVVDSLNQDIVTIFAALDEMESAIGNPQLLFSDDYPELDVLRKNYFHKLNNKMNVKGFFEFYKWFDTNFGTFLAQLLPYNAKFNGSNYVIESHMLERAKIQYKYEDNYLGPGNRDGLRSAIYLSLFQGTIGRY